MVFTGWAGLFAFLASASLCVLLRAMSHRIGLVDLPNHRSTHTSVTPRVGGLAIMITLVPLAIIMGTARPLVLAMSLLTFMGAVDDRLSLSAKWKLCGQLFIVFFALFLSVGYLSLTVIFLLTIGVTAALNFFNFMDGIDGLAGSQALLVTLFLYSISPAPYLLAFMGANAAFLIWNLPPASLFMGDAGSLAFGFLLSTHLVISMSDKPFLAIVVSIGLNATFLADAGLTVCRRFYHRKNIFSAHREHLYQRAFDAGVPTWVILGINAVATSGAGFMLLRELSILSSLLSFFCAAGVYHGCLLLAISRLGPRHKT